MNETRGVVQRRTDVESTFVGWLARGHPVREISKKLTGKFGSESSQSKIPWTLCGSVLQLRASCSKP